jgi:hypothetical protein
MKLLLLHIFVSISWFKIFGIQSNGLLKQFFDYLLCFYDAEIRKFIIKYTRKLTIDKFYFIYLILFSLKRNLEYYLLLLNFIIVIKNLLNFLHTH